eukprot:CAMPEP_0185756184 /NCGR_PEP_ID=MMETSP1174-20130828/14619_1 /TAXON_ID=35687 /ORGANISM="Dictyocha speculum, Strain CCMP1381" /LENGTH=79 /DNA_ID=CAMNT_0028435043 /DNA_START=54 /DNA_END=289 /DNA_ORIENTATION=+
MRWVAEERQDVGTRVVGCPAIGNIDGVMVEQETSPTIRVVGTFLAGAVGVAGVLQINLEEPGTFLKKLRPLPDVVERVR